MQSPARMVFGLSLLMAACNGASDDADVGSTSDADQAAGGEAGFTSTIAGAVETEIEGSGYFQCDLDGEEYNIGPSSSFKNNVLIQIAGDTEPGTYELVSGSMDQQYPTAMYIGENLQTDYYEQDVTGTITLDAVPQETGDRVAGSFEFTAANEAGDSVTVTGRFDFLTDSQRAFYNCQ